MLEWIILQVIITNVSNSTTPWNTGCLSSAANAFSAPCVVVNNLPWVAPLLTLVLLLMADYELGIKKGLEAKSNFFTVTLVFTMLAYVEVIGGLTTVPYFFFFEFLCIISIFIITLFHKNQ